MIESWPWKTGMVCTSGFEGVWNTERLPSQRPRTCPALLPQSTADGDWANQVHESFGLDIESLNSDTR